MERELLAANGNRATLLREHSASAAGCNPFTGAARHKHFDPHELPMRGMFAAGKTRVCRTVGSRRNQVQEWSCCRFVDWREVVRYLVQRELYVASADVVRRDSHAGARLGVNTLS